MEDSARVGFEPVVSRPLPIARLDQVPAFRDLFRGIVAPGATLVIGTAAAIVTGDEIIGLGIAAITLLALVLTTSLANLERALLAIAILEIPLQVDVYFGHDERIAELNAVSGVAVSVTTAILICLYVIWALTPLRERSSAGRDLAPSLAYLAVAAASISWALDATLALYEVNLLVQGFLLFMYIVFRVRGETVLLVTSALLIGVLVQALIVFLLYLGLPSLELGPVRAFAGDRATGTLGSPNVLGSSMGLLFGLAVAFGIGFDQRAYRLLGWTAAASAGAVLVLTASRGGWLGTALAMSVFGVLTTRRLLVSPRLALIVGVGLASVLLMFGGLILDRMSEFDNAAAQDRIPLMSLGADIAMANPIGGVGANNFMEAVQQRLDVDFQGNWVSTVHNRYLLVWSETGTLALVAFVWMLVLGIRRGLQAWRDAPLPFSVIGLGLAAGIASNSIHMIFDLFHSRYQIEALWLVLGLVSSLALSVHTGQDRRDPSVMASVG